MRDDVVNYLKSLTTGFVVSSELPFDANGTALYIKNPKRFYVDAEQVSVEPFIALLNAKDILLTTWTVTVYLVVDAKQTTQAYKDTVAAMRDVKAMDVTNKYIRKSSEVFTEFEKDLVITSVELRFSRITT